MKQLFLAIGALLLAGGAAAQPQSPNYEFGGLVLSNDAMSVSDIFALSQTQANFGTARAMAMGGAFTSLGADLSAMKLNPAGLGMYRQGDVAITPIVDISRAETPRGLAPSRNLPMGSNSQTRFALGNLGAVFNLYEGLGSVLSVNLGVGYNRLADYNYDYSFETRGSNRAASLADALSVQLEAGGATLNRENQITMNGLRDYRIDPFFWPAVAGYKSFLVDCNDNGIWYPGEIGNNATIDGGASVRSRGSAGEFDIAMGANINNRLYVGATVGILSISQRREIYYGEGYSYNGANGYNDSTDPSQVAVDADGKRLDNVMQSMGLMQAVDVEGAGVNLKLGVVYRPVDGLRLGFAFHTPTWYYLDRTYQLSMATRSLGPTDADKGDFRPHENLASTVSDRIEDSGDSQWRFASPARMLFGASYTLGRVAIFSVDYERTWYNGIRVKNTPYTPYRQSEGDFKRDFKHYFKGANTIRAGVEVRPVQRVALRAGYGHTGSMLRDEATILSSPAVRESSYYTAGAGVRLGRRQAVYLDLAYCYTKSKTTPYMLFYGNKYASAGNEIYESGRYVTDFADHTLALTVGFRF